MRKFVTEENIKTFKEYYLENKSLKEIGRLCGFDASTIKRYLVKFPELGLKTGTKCTRKVTRNPFLDLNDNETMYWLGWLASDGAIYKNAISLELAEDSMDVLENYKKFLGENANIQGPYHVHAVGQNSYSIKFQNKDAVNYLSDLGITSNKSKSLKINFPITWDFIRGVFEGDGTVYKSEIANTYFAVLNCNILSASELFINQIFEFFKNNNIKCTLNCERRSNNRVYYRVWISYTDSYNFFKKMYYSDDIPVLIRKYNKFKEFFDKSGNNYQLYLSEKLNTIKYANKLSSVGAEYYKNELTCK